MLGWAYCPPPPAQVRMAPLLRNGMRSRRRTKNISGRQSNVRLRAIGPMTSGRSMRRRKRLVSRIWLDKVLAGEREVENLFVDHLI